MKLHRLNRRSNPASQQGISLIVAMVMLIVLTLVGVSSMNTAVVELKMAGSMQQQNLALNRANELLRVAETRVEEIVNDPGSFDFASTGDGYYTTADNVKVSNLDWDGQGLVAIKGQRDKELYIIEYLGPTNVPGESEVYDTEGKVIGGLAYTFRLTARSTTGKNALRLVQSLYVTGTPP